MTGGRGPALLNGLIKQAQKSGHRGKGYTFDKAVKSVALIPMLTQNVSDLDGKIKTKEPRTLEVRYVKKEGQD